MCREPEGCFSRSNSNLAFVIIVRFFRIKYALYVLRGRIVLLFHILITPLLLYIIKKAVIYPFIRSSLYQLVVFFLIKIIVFSVLKA